MKILKLLFSSPPFLIINKILEKFALRTRSAPHQSILAYNKIDDAKPIFLFGFARSGTTTLQKIISKSFKYNASFEPISFNHSNQNNDDHLKISTIFRGAPCKADLPLYNINGALLSTLHTHHKNKINQYLISLLEKTFLHLFRYYGQNVVIKELRLITNTSSVAYICKKQNIRPIFLFLISDPLMTIYTYYRLGGLIEFNDIHSLRVNEIYEYRKITYSSLDQFSDLVNIDCKNKYEKLFLSILMDQRYMQLYAKENPHNSFTIDLENCIQTFKDISIKYNLTYEEDTGIKIKNTKRYKNDPFFMKNLKQKISSNIFTLLSEYSPGQLPEKQINFLESRMLVTHLKNKVLELVSDKDQFNKI